MIVIDMDKPKNCFDCDYSLTDAHGAYCALADNEIKEGLDIYEGTNNRSTICPIKCDIEDIKQEIAEYKDDKVIHAERNEMIDIVLEIIDKHIGKNN